MTPEDDALRGETRIVEMKSRMKKRQNEHKL